MYKRVVLPDQPFKEIMLEKNNIFPTDRPYQKLRVGKGQTKYFLI